MTLNNPSERKRLPTLLRNLLLLLGVSTLAGLGGFWANVTKGTESLLNIVITACEKLELSPSLQKECDSRLKKPDNLPQNIQSPSEKSPIRFRKVETQKPSFKKLEPQNNQN